MHGANGIWRLALIALLPAVVGGGVWACSGGGDDDDDDVSDDDVSDGDVTDDDTADDDDDDAGDDDTSDDDTGPDDDLADDDTSSLPPLPEGVFDIFSEDDLNAVADAGMTLNGGGAAMDVQKNYLIDSLELVYDDDGPTGATFGDIYLRFREQKEDGAIIAEYIGDAPGGASESSPAGYISALGNCISAYVDQDAVQGECAFRRPTIFSGCLNDVGVVNFQWAQIIKDKTPPDSQEDSPCLAVPPEGSVRIFEESDEVVDIWPTFGES